MKITRILAAAAFALLALASNVQAQTGRMQLTLTPLATTVTGTGTQAAVTGMPYDKTFQATGATSAGSGSGVVAVQCSNDGSNWDTLGTITLTLGTTSTSDSFASADRCYRLRANVTTLTGTGATLNVTAGY